MANNPINKNELFTLLVTQLSSGAWSQLGKTPNPLTGKAEQNLEAASMTIDILETLLFKTAGNLNRTEDKVLSDSVRELRLSLIQEQQGR
jgi:CheY-specific phosphatase CheX